MPPLFIVEGETTNDFPQVVFIEIYGVGTDKTTCSGTLIAPDQVVTAAHCLDDVYGFDPTGYRVMVGEDLYDWSARFYDVDRAEYNTAYNTTCKACGHDIGLLWLSEPVEGVTPMGLSVGEYDVWTGDPLIYVGYGKTSASSGSDPARRKVVLPTTLITSEVLYAEDPAGSQGVCYGDSGGAAIVRTDEGFQLAGVISFMESEDCSGEAASTRIAAQTAWLDRHGADYSIDATPARAVIVPDEGCDCSSSGASGAGLSTAAVGLSWLLRRRRR